MPKRYVVTEDDGCVESFCGCGCLLLLIALLIPLGLLLFNGFYYGDWTVNIQEAQAIANVQNQPYSNEAGNALLGNGAIKVVQSHGNVSVHLGSTGILTFDDITVKDAGEYVLTLYYKVRDNFSVQMIVNNSNPTLLSFDPSFNSLTANLILVAGTNKIEFSHAKGSGNSCNTGKTDKSCDTINGIIVQKG